MSVDAITDYLKQYGMSLSELIPGKDEFAIKADDAGEFIDLLKWGGVKVVGGDILVKNDTEIGYAHQVWGGMYHYLSWSIDNEGDSLESSYALAKKSVVEAERVSKNLGGKVWVSFVCV